MRNIKKILPRIAILVVFVLLLENGARFLYESYDSYARYTRIEYQQEKGTIDTLFCGTSRTYSGINPDVYDELTGSNSFNLATGAQSITNTYYIIKDAIRNNPIKTVYLEISIPTLTDYANDSSRVGSYDRVYSLLGKLEAAFLEGSGNLQFRYLFYSTRIEDYFDLKAVKKNVTYKLSDQGDTAPVTKESKLHYISKGFCSSSRVYDGKTSGKIKKRYQWSRDKIEEDSLNALKNILTLCAENDVEVILHSPPIFSPVLPLVGDLNDMHACFQEIADEYGVTFYDMNFLIDHEATFSNEMFRDSMHMNINGATTFTSTLAKLYLDQENASYYFTESYVGELKEE